MLPIASTVMMQSLTLRRFFQVHAFSREFNSFWVGKSSLTSMALKVLKKKQSVLQNFKKIKKLQTTQKNKYVCEEGGVVRYVLRVCVRKKVYLRSICLFIEVVPHPLGSSQGNQCSRYSSNERLQLTFKVVPQHKHRSRLFKPYTNLFCPAEIPMRLTLVNVHAQIIHKFKSWATHKVFSTHSAWDGEYPRRQVHRNISCPLVIQTLFLALQWSSYRSDLSKHLSLTV